jgi:hypothetical protein
MSLRLLSETFHVFGNSALATIPVIPAVVRQRVSVYRLIITAATPAVTIVIQDTSGAALSQIFQGTATTLLRFDEAPGGDPWWTTAAGLGVQLVQSGTSQIGFDFWYLQRGA